MPPKKKEARLTIFLPNWIHTGFKKLVADKRMSMNAWIVQMLRDAVVAGGYGRPPRQYQSIAELISFHQNALQKSSLSWELKEKLLKYAAGTTFDPLDLVRIAATLNFDESKLVELYNESIEIQEEKDKCRQG